MATNQNRTTITDVARSAGVSVSTASRALNGRDRVDERTRALIRATADELEYQPNVHARRLRSGRSHAIALVNALPESVVSEISELGFMLELAVPVAREFLRCGYTLMLVPPVADIAQLDALDVDGAVLLDSGANDPIAELLRRRGIKIVTLGKSALADGYLDRGNAGADIMLAHLSDRGARHVGVILSVEDYSVTSTVLDYISDVQRLPVPVSVVRARAEDGESAGYRAALELLSADASIDAIYAPIDAFAAGSVRAAHDLGLSVPKQVMVATNYDGRRATASEPPITALNLDFPGLGREIANLMLHALDAEESQVAPSPTPCVIARASTARA